MQPQPQKKLAHADRILGSIVLYRPAAKTQFKTPKAPLRAEPWSNKVFGVPLLLRTLGRLVFVCRHRHKGPPVTLREPIPSNLSGCKPAGWRGSYITCLDCGQKFAYNHKTGRLVDFWGVHDAEALARVRRRLEGFFSPLRGLAARVDGVPRLIVEEAASELGRNKEYAAQRPAAGSAKVEKHKARALDLIAGSSGPTDPRITERKPNPVTVLSAPPLSFLGSRTENAPSSTTPSSRIPSAKKRALILEAMKQIHVHSRLTSIHALLLSWKRGSLLWVNCFLLSISLAKWRRVFFAVLRKVGQAAFA
ncbi:MAG: hypothetical protein WBW58_12080, partial [Candidatus Acidiferrum sp.]